MLQFKTTILTGILGVFACCTAHSRELVSAIDTVPAGRTGGGFSQLLSVLVQAPFERFERSHGVGFGAEYAWSPHRFGSPATPVHKAGWILKGGVDYFIGGSEPESGYAFRYGNYLYAHVMGGLIYNPVQRADLFITAGPGLGLYSGSPSIGFNAAFTMNIFIRSQYSIGPSITFRKHKEANSLWTAGLRAGFALR